ncbi:PLP-dependent aminotransferase family protein [Lysinibacillus sp. SGAir0095]|uniref:MocR-like pyridoxine biosynthesis transcription factor PdxR n=1 Tax=Lysinibacillus sp. SGAir0095 TaxID=2070463 RepID=UPI0010CD2A77|nr:PLP-dependent aminotransferase family protein [Lysinibacillus sp. SGAir0095]QCR32302.1 GntR family transcriptional regulator [Lysinibacillus sp. SGAir0095]
MEISIHFSNKKAKYLDIYEQLKNKIVSQTLSANEKLPSKRSLATILNVSIHTVKEAYEQLASEGYIYSVERSGYYISAYDVEWTQSIHEEEKKILKSVPKIQYNFKNGQVDHQAFPLKIWLKLYRKHLNSDIVPNGPWQGELSLREQIAIYITKSRGFTCDVDQIFVYSGTQHQLNELSRFFGNVNVAIEEPGFRRATAILQQNQLSIEFVPIDEKGAGIPAKSCQYYYITPAHQFPLGGVMPIERRIDLLKWASENDAFLIEDDYDSEFRYKGSPVPPLAQIDQLQRVIYFGTFSKTLMPSIRMSYMILPKTLVAKFNSFYGDHKTTVSKIDQFVIAELMESGLYTKHIAKMRTLYRKKRLKLIENLQFFLGPEYEIIGDAAGLHIVLKLPKSLDETTAIQLAQDAGIALDPISSSYQLSNNDNLVMMGYGAISYNDIEEAVSLLSTQWKNHHQF